MGYLCVDGLGYVDFVVVCVVFCGVLCVLVGVGVDCMCGVC